MSEPGRYLLLNPEADVQTHVPCPKCEQRFGDSDDFDPACDLCEGTKLVPLDVRMSYRRMSSLPPSQPCDQKENK